MHTISGKIIKGDQYGRTLGFPTANIETTDALPPAGVYAGSAVLDGTTYRAGILINPNGKLEAHLIGYDGNAYEKMITLEIEKYLREYKKFDTEAELITQIKKDIEQCLQA